MHSIKSKLYRKILLSALLLSVYPAAHGEVIVEGINAGRIREIVHYMLIKRPSWKDIISKMGKTNDAPSDYMTEIKPKYGNISNIELIYDNEMIYMNFKGISGLKLSDLEAVLGKPNPLIAATGKGNEGEVTFSMKENRNSCRVIARVPLTKSRDAQVKSVILECEYNIP